MSFLQREIDKIHNGLLAHKESDKKYQLLHAASQALAWAIDPTCYKSPYNTIMGIHEEQANCSGEPRQLPS